MGQLLFKKAFPHIVAIITFLLLNIVYFYPQLEGKVIKSTDDTQYNAMRQELKEFRIKNPNETILWTNSMFGGMPAYQISPGVRINLTRTIINWGKFKLGDPIGLFFLGMLYFYILLILLGVSPYLAILGAVAFGFNTNNFVLWSAGHASKLFAVMAGSLILAGTVMVFKRKYLTGFLIFTLGMAISVTANHVQMTYYFGLCMILYVLLEIFQALKQQKWKGLIVAGSILLVGVILGIAADASNIWTTFEYSQETMRGNPILVKDTPIENSPKKVGSSSEVEGLDWEYAMAWSNGKLDIMTGLVASAAGGSSNEKISQSSPFAKEVIKRGGRTEYAPLYWGDLPFTSGPAYFGAIIFFLFFLGLTIVKGTIKWWLGLATLFTILLSMGKNFEAFNQLIFNYLPLYSKFRAPSSILTVTSLFIPLLGTLALSEILKGQIKKQELLKKLKITTIIIGGGCLFLYLLGPTLFDFSSSGDGAYQQQGLLNALLETRIATFKTDAIKSFILILISSGLIWGLVNKKINQTIFLLIMGAAVLFDLYSVGQRYLSANNFITNTEKKTTFSPRPVDQQILNAEPKGRGYYRVLDLSINTFNSANSSYFYNTIGGYSAAKLQRIADIIDRHIVNGNQRVLNMLNTKYIINRDQQLQQNSQALGNAWFVGGIKKVVNPNEEIDNLSNFDPANEAIILDSEFPEYLGDFTPTKNGSISMVNYLPHKLTYNSSSSSEQLAVFSEIWYGHNKGWRVTIDGTEVPFIRANYLLRALRIPAGEHTIEFSFKPNSFFIGEKISFAISLLLILGLLALIGFRGFQFYQNLDNIMKLQMESKEKQQKQVKKLIKTKRKRGKPKK